MNRRTLQIGGRGFGLGGQFSVCLPRNVSECPDTVVDLLEGRPPPPIRRVVEDVDIKQLDQGHVIPNMDPPVWRGVWFLADPIWALSRTADS